MMGFDALVINRIPDEEMDIAKANKSELNRTTSPRTKYPEPDTLFNVALPSGLEFIWGGSSNLGPESHLYTHVFDSYFCMPGTAQMPPYVSHVASCFILRFHSPQCGSTHYADGFRWGMEGDGSPVVTDKNVGIRALALAGAILPRKDW